MKKEFEFLEERSKQIKEEIKSRKQWEKALKHELMLERTYKEHQENNIKRMLNIANTMIKYYENILKEHEEMIEELNKGE